MAQRKLPDNIYQTHGEDYLLITHTKSGSRRQDHVSTIESATHLMVDFSRHADMPGGMFELVWQGHIIGTFKVAW